MISDVNIYTEKAQQTVERILKENRNQLPEVIQKALSDGFPFHKSNVVAWREYAKEIKRQWGAVMF